MKTLADNLTVIVRRLGEAIITECENGLIGYCLSGGGGSEACATTIAEVAAWFVAQFDADLAGPLEYPQRSER